MSLYKWLCVVSLYKWLGVVSLYKWLGVVSLYKWLGVVSLYKWLCVVSLYNRCALFSSLAVCSSGYTAPGTRPCCRRWRSGTIKGGRRASDSR